MYRKVLVLSGSTHGRYYSDKLGDEFIRGAKENGHVTVEKIDLARWGCLACCKILHCIESAGNHGGMDKLYEAICGADIILVTSPVGRFFSYGWLAYEFIRRSHEEHRRLRNKTVYLIAATLDPSDHQKKKKTILSSFRRYISNFENIQEGGHVLAFFDFVADAVKHNLAMQQAYEMGKNIHIVNGRKWSFAKLLRSLWSILFNRKDGRKGHKDKVQFHIVYGIFQ